MSEMQTKLWIHANLDKELSQSLLGHDIISVPVV